MLTDERIAEIKARAKAATKGPWTIERGEYTGRNWLLGSSSMYDTDVFVALTTDGVHASESDGDPVTDGEFIAHARTDIPALVAEVERLRVELEKQKARVETWREAWADETDNPRVRNLLGPKEDEA